VCDESVTLSDWPGLTYYFNVTTVRLRKGDTETGTAIPQRVHSTLPAIRAALCLHGGFAHAHCPRPRATYMRDATRVPSFPAEFACTLWCCQRQTQWDRPSPATKEGRKEEKEAEALGSSWLLDTLGLALGSLRCIAFPLQLSACASVLRSCINYPGAARLYLPVLTFVGWVATRFRFHFKGSCEAFSAGEFIFDQICELDQICDMGRSRSARRYFWKR